MRQRIAGAVQALDRFFPAGLSVQGMSAKAGRKGDGKGSCADRRREADWTAGNAFRNSSRKSGKNL